MYKSLLRKIEFLAPLWKVWRLHFLAPTYSSAHIRLSACLLGVSSPNTAQQRCTVCPTVPPTPTRSPVVEEGGERGAWVTARPRLQRTGLLEVTSGVLVKQVGEHLWVRENVRKIVRSLWTPTQISHSDTLNGDRVRATSARSGGVDTLFYSGEEVGVVRRKPAPHRRKRIGRGMKEEREGGRERLFRAWFLSFIVCLLRFEYSLSQQMRKMPQTLALLASSLFFSICN